jgi:16S rRNA (guanine966-N2)-methyltransferase
MIRVISGRYKGRRLKRVPDSRVRPMPDKLKGAIFSILAESVKGSTFLDGFAGTGSVGIEALSRGAETAVFIEEYPAAVKIIKDNLVRCGAEDLAVVVDREFNRAVIELARRGACFDIVFLDPPYRLLEKRNPLKVIFKRGILAPSGLIVLRRHFKIAPEIKEFALARTSRIGDDILDFFRPPPLAGAKKIE